MGALEIVLIIFISVLTLSCAYLLYKLKDPTFLLIAVWGPVAAAALILQDSSISGPLVIAQAVITVAVCLCFLLRRFMKYRKAKQNRMEQGEETAPQNVETDIEQDEDLIQHLTPEISETKYKSETEQPNDAAETE